MDEKIIFTTITYTMRDHMVRIASHMPELRPRDVAGLCIATYSIADPHAEILRGKVIDPKGGDLLARCQMTYFYRAIVEAPQEMLDAGFLYGCIWRDHRSGRLIEAPVTFIRWFDEEYWPAVSKKRGILWSGRLLAHGLIMPFQKAVAPLSVQLEQIRQGVAAAKKKLGDESPVTEEELADAKATLVLERERDPNSPLLWVLRDGRVVAGQRQVRDRVLASGTLASRSKGDRTARDLDRAPEPESRELEPGEAADVPLRRLSALRKLRSLRKFLAERSRLKKGGRSGEVVRRNLESLLLGQITAAELARRARLNKSTITRAYDRELKACRRELRRQGATSAEF
jgi:hypothetical protein